MFFLDRDLNGKATFARPILFWGAALFNLRQMRATLRQ
jgi:hypothetical protein